MAVQEKYGRRLFCTNNEMQWLARQLCAGGTGAVCTAVLSGAVGEDEYLKTAGVGAPVSTLNSNFASYSTLDFTESQN